MSLSETITQPEVLAALISSLFTTIAALVPTFVIYRISKRFLGNKRFIRMAVYAMREILVLRAVINELADERTQRQARKSVFETTGLKTENRFTPADLERKLASYEEKLGESLTSVEIL